MKIKYKCKDNDAQLKFIIVDRKIDEVLIRSDKKGPWTVVGFDDFMKGIKEVKQKINHKLKPCKEH